MERNELCWCGSGKKYKKCHLMIEEKIAYHADKGEIVPTRDMLKTIPQIEGIQKSADLNTAVLDHVAAHIHAGMSTAEIDKLVYDYTTEHGGIPAPLNYQGFPKSVCTSINNEICHGIPDENIILEEGDIINVDVSTILDGYFSDASRMFMIGKVSERAEKLVRVTQECVELGLAQAKPWNHLGDIADAINSHAKANGYSVVEEIGGHGVGLEFHEEPWVSYVTPKGSEMLLVPGMIFTIEPMINEGSPEFFVDEDNDWTVYTEDDGLSAQVEYMVRITDDGAVSICGTDAKKMEEAQKLIHIIVTDYEAGQVLEGKVISIKEFGAFLEFAPGKEGMVHISKLSKERVNRVEDVLTLGDVVKVVCLGKDKMGRFSFSMKDVAE